MRKVASITGVVLVSTLLISLTAAASSVDGRKPPSFALAHPGSPALERDVRAIAEVRQQWLHAVNEGALGAMLAAYAPGAVVSPGNGPPLLGAADIGAFHRRWDSDAKVFYDLDAQLVSLEGDLAVEEWSAYVTVTPHEDALGIGSDVFQYRQGGLRVYRKGADGSWHIDRETWSADPPAVLGYAHGHKPECIRTVR